MGEWVKVLPQKTGTVFDHAYFAWAWCALLGLRDQGEQRCNATLPSGRRCNGVLAPFGQHWVRNMDADLAQLSGAAAFMEQKTGVDESTGVRDAPRPCHTADVQAVDMHGHSVSCGGLDLFSILGPEWQVAGA